MQTDTYKLAHKCQTGGVFLTSVTSPAADDEDDGAQHVALAHDILVEEDETNSGADDTDEKEVKDDANIHQVYSSIEEYEDTPRWRRKNLPWAPPREDSDDYDTDLEDDFPPGKHTRTRFCLKIWANYE